MHLSSHDYVSHQGISRHIEQTIAFFYISESFPIINGLNKYMLNLSPVPECILLYQGDPLMIDQLLTGPDQPAS